MSRADSGCKTCNARPCSVCGRPRDRPGQRYCRECHAAYVQAWRAAGREHLSPEQRRRAVARSVAGVYKRRGRLVPGPCEVGVGCEGPIEMHHDDYSRPLDVRWLCRKHHVGHHKD